MKNILKKIAAWFRIDSCVPKTESRKIAERWAADLKSGKFEQNRGNWNNSHRTEDGKATAHCCLDVLAVSHLGAPVVVQHRTHREQASDPNAVDQLLTDMGFSMMIFVRMNDDEQKSFEEIGDYILENAQ